MQKIPIRGALLPFSQKYHKYPSSLIQKGLAQNTFAPYALHWQFPAEVLCGYKRESYGKTTEPDRSCRSLKRKVPDRRGAIHGLLYITWGDIK